MIEVKNLTKGRIPTDALLRAGKLVLKKEKKESCDVSLVFLGEAKMQEPNRIYRGKDKSTNVLSFPSGNDKIPSGVEGLGLGELVLCPAVIRKDAAKYGITFKAELCRIFIHGLLHLVGYDHEKEVDFKTMSHKEEEYLSLAS